jgi:hypothetical protein
MAAVPQRELLQQRSDGSRLLDLVFDQAKSAGLITASEAAADIKSRLLALFDAALTVGLCLLATTTDFCCAALTNQTP